MAEPINDVRPDYHYTVADLGKAEAALAAEHSRRPMTKRLAQELDAALARADKAEADLADAAGYAAGYLSERDKAEAALAECKAEWERRCSLANQIGLDWMYDAKALAEALEDLAEGAYFVRNDATAAMLNRARDALAAHKEASRAK